MVSLRAIAPSWPLGPRARLVASGVLVAIPALALYLVTLMPDVGFWDTAEFQAIGPVLGIAHPTGYPTYTLLAWLASVLLQPFGNEALRANMLSALLAAGGCAIVGVTVTWFTGRLIAGVGAGLVLALATETWSNALHAEPHALHLFLVAVVLALLAVWRGRVRAEQPSDRWLIAAAAMFGVSLGNHALTLLLAPGIGLFVLAVQPAILRRPRTILACVAALALTTVALYAYLPLRSAMDPPLDYANPETWEGFRYLVFAEQFRGDFQALPGPIEAIRRIIGETWTQLGVLAPLALIGAVHAAIHRRTILLLLGTWFLVNWVFALGYVNADIGRYYLVPLMSVAVLGGLGAAALIDTARGLLWGMQTRSRRRLRMAVAGVAALVLLGPALVALPVRLPKLDQSDDTLARRWIGEMGQQLPQDAVVISWWSFSTTMWYAQYVEGWRPDVTVIDDRTMVDQGLGDVEDVIDAYLGSRPVYLIRLEYDIPRFDERYELMPLGGVSAGPVYEVQGRDGAANL